MRNDETKDLIGLLQIYTTRFSQAESFVAEIENRLDALHHQVQMDDVKIAYSIHQMTRNDINKSDVERDSLKSMIDRDSDLQHMAFRDGAMTLYHFNDVLKSLGKVVRNLHCPEDIRTRVEIATQQFHTGFPNIVGLRNTVGHEGDNLSSSKERERHGVKGDVDDGMIQAYGSSIFTYGNITNRTFSSTYQKQLVSYVLSEDSVAALNRITTEVAAIFAR